MCELAEKKTSGFSARYIPGAEGRSDPGRRNSVISNRGALEPRIAVLIPCYNEGSTIQQVVKAFQEALPGAIVYVYDNNSSDDTIAKAMQAGAVVRCERLQGKGHVVRRMFSDIDVDVYVLVDGDDTYDAGAAPEMVQLLLDESLDMVVGRRVDEDVAAYRTGHRLGNAVLTGAVARLFGARFHDILSGYRIFSRRFVRSFPIFTQEFEIETEITVHALNLQVPIAEIPSEYRARPAGSVSKLRTYRDGMKILATILFLLRSERPLLFFSFIAAALMTAAIVLAYPVFVTFLELGIVPRLPTAVLATGLAILAFLSLTCGLILDTVTRGRREQCMLAYLTVPRWQKPAEPTGVGHVE